MQIHTDLDLVDTYANRSNIVVDEDGWCTQRKDIAGRCKMKLYDS